MKPTPPASAVGAPQVVNSFEEAKEAETAGGEGALLAGHQGSLDCHLYFFPSLSLHIFLFNTQGCWREEKFPLTQGHRQKGEGWIEIS